MSDKPILIKGGRVMTPDSDPHVPKFKDILIEGTHISEVGIDIAAPSAAKIIND